MLSVITQRRALQQSEEIKILNISFPRVGIEPIACRVCNHMLVITSAPRLISHVSEDNYYKTRRMKCSLTKKTILINIVKTIFVKMKVSKLNSNCQNFC